MGLEHTLLQDLTLTHLFKSQSLSRILIDLVTQKLLQILDWATKPHASTIPCASKARPQLSGLASVPSHLSAQVQLLQGVFSDLRSNFKLLACISFSDSLSPFTATSFEGSSYFCIPAQYLTNKRNLHTYWIIHWIGIIDGWKSYILHDGWDGKETKDFYLKAKTIINS